MSTIESLEGSIKEKCIQLSEILGVEEVVSEKVLIAAIEDDNYARNLLTTRRAKPLLNQLLKNPPEIKRSGDIEISNAQLVGKAAKAILKWGQTGFSTVSMEVLKKREDACLACPNLSSPKKSLQKLVTSEPEEEVIGKRASAGTCALCGCGIAKKIKMTSEACPGEHPSKEGYTRWDELDKSRARG